MEEKYMVNDVLECTKNLLKTYFLVIIFAELRNKYNFARK